MMALNKTIAVLGAGGLLGKELVHSLLQAGAQVVAVDVNEESLIQLHEDYSDSKRIIFLPGNIADLDFTQQIFAVANSHFKGLDGAVNSAYPKNPQYGRPFEEVSYEDFCENLSLHVGAYFLFMQQAVKYSSQEQKAFSLVNISSIYGSIAPRFEVYDNTSITMPVEYAAIKSAINHLSLYVAKYTQKSLFRVNCVSPGGIYAQQDPSFVNAYNRKCHGKGLLNTEDIIPSILFLLSEDSKHILGQNFIVDDGFSL